MYNENDILTRLQNGETPETIAAEVTNALNKAIAMKQEADAKAAEAARQAEIQKEQEAWKLQKISDLEGILNNIFTWCATYYPNEDWDEVTKTISAVDIIDLIEGFKELTVQLDTLGLPMLTKKVPFSAKPGNKANPDAVISQFLKDMGLK